MTDTIAPEISKFYRTRDGYRAGPMEDGGTLLDTTSLIGWILGTGGRRYKPDGTHQYGNKDLDLVAEWVDADDADEIVHNRIADEFTDDELATAARWPEETSEAQTLADAQYTDDPHLRSEDVTQDALAGTKYMYSWPEVRVIGTTPYKLKWSAAADHTKWSEDSAQAYTEIRTQIPPVLEIENGRLVIKLVHENLTLIAEVGDGRFFFSQVIAKLVDPALLAAHKTAAFVREYAAPND